MPVKKRKRDRSATIRLEPFFYELTVILSSDFNKTIDMHQLGENFYDKAGVTVGMDSFSYIIFDTECIDHGVIAHECAHAIFNALEEAGQDPAKGEETFTYLLQHVVNFTHALCKKHKIVLK